MPLTKENLALSFTQGLDTKADPFQIPMGRLSAMANWNFNKTGRLDKRNGYGFLTSLPTGASATTLTTLGGNLTALGKSLYAYSRSSSSWLAPGRIQPVQLSVQTLVRSSSNQSSVDVAVTSNNIACAVYLDGDGNYKYQITDATTGQVLVPAVTLGSVIAPRVAILGNYFVITYISSTSLFYVAIPLLNLTNPTAPTSFASTMLSGGGYDVLVYSGIMYVAWAGTDGGGAIRIGTLNSSLTIGAVAVFTTKTANLLSLTIDTTQTNPSLWISIWDSSSTSVSTFAVSTNLASLVTFKTLASSITISQLTSFAQAGNNTALYQITNDYSFASVRSDFVSSNTCTLTGTIGTAKVVARSVGLASKAFINASVGYFLATYGGAFQPTYFLIDALGNVVARIAYSNGGGYITTQVLPSVSIQDNVAQMGYLFTDLISSVNKALNPLQVSGIYSQTGVNLVSFNLSDQNLVSAEIAGSLYIAGGFLWMYDGVKPVEQGFHLWPEDVVVTTATSGGFLTAQQYYYQVTYEWTDAVGNVHRSAPSIPTIVTTTGSTSANTINIPTARLTYKTAPNGIRICLYRWSTAQQNFYQVTSVSSPTLNDPTADSIAITDTLADGSIIGNALIYTTGGVVENIAGPACNTLCLFNSRLMLVDAEDTNLVWYSKQVIEATPVEMSDLFTIFTAPTTGAQGSTGPTLTLAPMDDKLIAGKANALYYLTGLGPDNTGANSDFSGFTFITATVGCSNQSSIVFIPSGLVFQSPKGMWLLGRDLGTSYIGSPVEAFNSNIVSSAISVPGTNQVRFTMPSVTLTYDYFFQQWGTYTNTPATSSTLYQGMHTYLDQFGRVFQEINGSYVDGSNPVNTSLTTSWINMAGLQGFQRAYEFFLLAQYLSPHTLTIQIAYDYNPSPVQTMTISPDNFAGPYGTDPNYYGQGSPYGGPGNIEAWRVFLSKQKCEAFQITIQEAFDPTKGTTPGAGFTLSGLDIIVGIKGNYPRRSAARSVG